MNIRHYTRLRHRCSCCRIRWVAAAGDRCAACVKLGTV